MIKDYVMPQGKNGNLASLMNIGTDRQELITSGPPSTPGGQLTTFLNGGRGRGLRGYFGVRDSRKSRYFGDILGFCISCISLISFT